MGRARVRYLLDSVILIDHFNGIEAATIFLKEHGGASSISAITRAEVLAGFTVRTESLARELLDVFQQLPITSEIADLSASLRHSERWKLPDALQAAVAVQHGLTLVTRDTRDFAPAGKLDVLVPYRV
jgi:predicted nucleic acid-binding protein